MHFAVVEILSNYVLNVSETISNKMKNPVILIDYKPKHRKSNKFSLITNPNTENKITTTAIIIIIVMLSMVIMLKAIEVVQMVVKVLVEGMTMA